MTLFKANNIKIVILGKNKVLQSYIKPKTAIKNDIITVSDMDLHIQSNAFFLCTSFWDKHILGVKSLIYYTEGNVEPVMIPKEKRDISPEELYQKHSLLVLNLANLLKNKLSTMDMIMMVMIVCCIGATLYAVNEIQSLGKQIKLIIQLLAELKANQPTTPTGPIEPVTEGWINYVLYTIKGVICQY